jgi:hypothetical protein
MTEKTMTGAELGEKLLASVRQMKGGKAANRIRDYGTKVLSERAPGVSNPSETEMNAMVNDLRS